MDKAGESAEADFQGYIKAIYPDQKLNEDQMKNLRTAFFGGIWVGIQVQKFRPEKAAEYELEVQRLSKNMMSVGALDKARGIDGE